MRQIDPVVLREERKRVQQRQSALGKAGAAGAALLWFHDCALGDKPIQQANKDAINILPECVASAVSGAKEAAQYLRLAADEVRQAVVERAITLAQADFDAAMREENI